MRPVRRRYLLGGLVIAFLALAGTGCAHQPQPMTGVQVELTSGYIVQGDRAAALVARVGGRVTHELAIINAVGAQLTAKQRVALLELDAVRVFDDRRLGLQ